jgi:membrane fusion protein (multidrug efflux system)
MPLENGTDLFYLETEQTCSINFDRTTRPHMPDGQQHSATLEASLFEAPAKTPWYKSRRGRTLLVGIGALMVALIALWAVRWWTTSRFLETTNNAYLRADAVIVSPKISGYVKEVLVGDNQPVGGGEALLRIDSTPYQASRDMAEADVAQRRADLIRFRADAARQEAVRTQAVAQVAVAEAAARFAAQDAARRQYLAQIGADATSRRDEAVSTRDQTAGQLTAARAAVEVAARQLDSLNAQIGQGEAALKAAEARVRSTQSDLDGVVVAAPLAGRVGDRTVRVGQFVQPGTRLMTVVPVQDIYLIANFKETQVGRMRPGQLVDVTVDALPGARITGTVDSLAPGTGSEFALLPPENATGNFTKIVQRVPVRIRLNADPALRDVLRPGLSVEVDVDTKPRDIAQ